MTTEIVKYDKDVAIIAALDEKYKGIKIKPGSEDDYAIVKAGLKEYRDYRIEVTNWHKVGKASILKAGKAYDTEKNKWLELITPGENKLKTIRQEEDDRIGDLERKRISDIKTLVRDIELMGLNAGRHAMPELEKMRNHIETMEWDEAIFEEFLADAQAAAYNAVISIKEAIEIRTKLDKEELERVAENDRLEKIRVEQEAKQKEIDETEKRLKEEKEKKDSIDIAFEDQKEWFKKHVKGDSFQTPNVDDLEKSIPTLQAMANHDVHDPSIQLLYDEQVIEAEGILHFRKEQAKLQEEKDALEADKKAEEDRKVMEAFEKQAKENAEKEAIEKVEREALDAENGQIAAEMERQRQESIMPDRDKILAFADGLDAIRGPVINDPVLDQILSDSIKFIQDLSTDIRKQVGGLS